MIQIKSCRLDETNLLYLHFKGVQCGMHIEALCPSSEAMQCLGSLHADECCSMSMCADALPHSSPSLDLMQVIYATACCGEEATSDGSFTPLTVNYNERFSAAGRTRYTSSSSPHPGIFLPRARRMKRVWSKHRGCLARTQLWKWLCKSTMTWS